MSLEHEQAQAHTAYPVEPVSPGQHVAAVESVHSWLARFAPLLEGLNGLSAAECRARLGRIEQLHADGQAALLALELHATQADLPLLSTLKDALAELKTVERDHRIRLGMLSPGDPQGQVDLASLRERLAATAARREVEALAGPTESAARLELTTATPNAAQAAVMGVFSLGWMAFTTFHAFFMIGGFSRVFGLFSLFMLAFYALFWAAGLGMAWTALRSLSREEVALDGRKLTVRRRYPFWTAEQQATLAPESRAFVRPCAWRQQNQPATELVIADETGAEVRFAGGKQQYEQELLADRINGYLARQAAAP